MSIPMITLPIKQDYAFQILYGGKSSEIIGKNMYQCSVWHAAVASLVDAPIADVAPGTLMSRRS